MADVADLNRALNRHGTPHFEAVATSGAGVAATLKAISKLVLLDLARRYGTAGRTTAGPSLTGGEQNA